MRSMTPNNSKKPFLIQNPSVGEIRSAKDVTKNMDKLAGAPVGVQIAAAWLLLSDTKWDKLLPQYVKECVTDAKPKASRKLDQTMNFVLHALTSRMNEMKEEQESEGISKHRNN